MRRDPVPWAIVLVVAVGLLATPWGQREQAAQQPAQQLSGFLGGDSEGSGYARVTGPRPFRFPADHGAHPDYRSEWWYVTGNLRDRSGDRYGFQLTFFRLALAPGMPPRESEWATRQAWMGHFAVTDVETGRHIASERFQRGALGLAGVQLGPFRAWVDDWSMRALPEAGQALFPLRLTAGTEGAAVELRLDAVKPRVLQGESGYSAKSEESGNASHYYSYTRLTADGRLRVGERWRQVEGSAWLDREWSTRALAGDQTGWDWFALQLEDGRDVMVYRLRRQDGSTDPASYGVVVGPDGTADRMGAAGFELTPLDHWRHPASQARYPVAWRLRLPEHGIDARVRAPVRDQLMDRGFRYWEGTVSVGPFRDAPAVDGVGYLEMTGY